MDVVGEKAFFSYVNQLSGIMSEKPKCSRRDDCVGGLDYPVLDTAGQFAERTTGKLLKAM